MWAKADIIILGLHQLMYLLHESCFSDLDQPVGSAARLLDILCEYPLLSKTDKLLKRCCVGVVFSQPASRPSCLLNTGPCRSDFHTGRTGPCACVCPSSLHKYALSRRFLTGLSILKMSEY